MFIFVFSPKSEELSAEQMHIQKKKDIIYRDMKSNIFNRPSANLYFFLFQVQNIKKQTVSSIFVTKIFWWLSFMEVLIL